MSGNDFKNRKDFRRRRKIVIEDDDWTSAGREFHSMEAATENERRPTVVLSIQFVDQIGSVEPVGTSPKMKYNSDTDMGPFLLTQPNKNPSNSNPTQPISCRQLTQHNPSNLCSYD